MRPEQQGFDESLGFLPGAAKYLSGGTVDARLPADPLDRFLWLALTDAVQFNGGPRFHAGEYMTDYLSGQAVAAIAANRNRPFFMYLAYSAPHTPFQAVKSDYDELSAIADHKTRVYGAMTICLHASADRQRSRRNGAPVLPYALHVANLFDGLMGFVQAPVSEATARGFFHKNS